MPPYRRLIALLCLPLLLAGCSRHLNAPSEPPPGLGSASQQVTRLEGLTYTPDDWPETLRADVYLPDDHGNGLRPAALVVHGGGWQRRDRSDMDGIALRLAQAGFVAINVEHRFAPAYQFPAQLHDLQIAMRWLHQHADEWRIDTRRLVGAGFSSGAHLVGLLGLSADRPELATPYGGEHTRLQAVLAGGMPTDLFKFNDGRLVVQFLGGTRAEVPEQYRLASPARQLGDSAPAFFLFHGTQDRLVPVDHAKDFHQALLDRGIHSELYLQRLRGHLTSFVTRGGAIDAGIDFLSRRVDD
ncbi:Acetyl esterase/lipase [Franzmannia pantelleriensis]|uniref:Acetyl esterase/lipase n=1 Tax=Franzmannia pantelleriensis TaxID=48727 RepID=A0A1G9MHA5_9GAMM|nr:alpha/beta hydrolase [Halomonas pantelleriensis]SDL73656.1 Acetyl esterase/lipase [Halomonas pantelleriensis]